MPADYTGYYDYHSLLFDDIRLSPKFRHFRSVRLPDTIRSQERPASATIDSFCYFSSSSVNMNIRHGAFRAAAEARRGCQFVISLVIHTLLSLQGVIFISLEFILFQHIISYILRLYISYVRQIIIDFILDNRFRISC